MKTEILDSAEEDLIDGFNLDENQSSGLGGYFLDSIFSDIESLHAYAGIHAHHFGYHRLLSKRFPFAIYYHLHNEIIRAYPLLDCGGSRAWTRDRL